MAKVLSKYSQAKNISKVEYTSQKEYNEALAKQQATAPPDDLDTPFSFKQWLDRNIGIIPGEEYQQYNGYLKNWYQNRYTAADASLQVKEDYKNLLREISVVMRNDEETAWINQMDYDDDLELEDAIPLFTEKIKEIAIYLTGKRSAVKKAKLKYNMAGSRNAVEKLFYEYLLKAFTKRENVLTVPAPSTWAALPDLSAVNSKFQIFVQELYDDTDYFDKDPIVPASAYFDFTDTDVTDYFETLEFESSGLDWLFSTGFAPLCAENPLIWTLSDLLEQYSVDGIQDLPLSAFILPNKQEIINDYQIEQTKKYLGEAQYIISGGFFTLKTKEFPYDMQVGNNWFFWPSGEYVEESLNEVFDPIQLSATSLIDNATPGLTYNTADKIFVQDSDGVQGAWLKTESQTSQDADMEAIINAGGTKLFKFPYPGYGVSGEALDWSGWQLSNADSTFDYIEDDLQEAIKDEYWSTNPSNSAIKPIDIHETTLIDTVGVTGSQTFELADKIYVRAATNEDNIHDSNPDNVYHDDFNRAWLYKMLKTDIPVKPEQNNIYWPLMRYEQDTALPFNITSAHSIPIALSGINVGRDLLGARAGHGLYDSDIIYKLDARDGFATECAFLSGVALNTLVPGATGKIQPSFSLKCAPGAYETFIWHGNNVNLNNTTITHKEHQKDCLYNTSEKDSIYDTRFKDLTLEEQQDKGSGNWKSCTCKAVYYSPIGHPGTSYDDYDQMADIIFVDKNWTTGESTGWPAVFDKQTWRGTDGNDYKTSKDFAWFKLDGDQIESDVGWGRGSWVNGDSSEFVLTSGVQYKYVRHNLKRNPDELFNKAVPDFIIRQEYSNAAQPNWAKATLQLDGTWISSTSASDMVLNPGDFILYDHVDSNWYCLTSIGTRGTAITYETSTINIIPGVADTNTPWLNYTYVTSGTDIFCTWPSTFTQYGPQVFSANELSAVSWTVVGPVSTYNTENINPFVSFSFRTDDIGVYQVSAVGYSSRGTESITYIPSVSSVHKEQSLSLSGDLDITTIYNDRIPVVINIPLSGWDYGTNSFNTSSLGGRPFWAAASDDDSQITKFKGTNIWGGGIRTPVDEYTFITQPDPASFSLSSNKAVEYIHNGLGFVWNQPVSFIVFNEQKQWNKLIIDESVTSPLSDYLFNITEEMIVSATEIQSDIVLEHQMFVNYWANNAFTWVQELTDSSIGVPPDGGLWTAITSGLLVDPVVPYANLTNRHYPTIASMPYVGGLYSTEDVGGFFVPKYLGASVYVGEGVTNVFETTGLPNDQTLRGLSAVVTNPEYYAQDFGLTQTQQNSIIKQSDNDSSWLKAGVTNGLHAGTPIKIEDYQEFIPYQSRYETVKSNSVGLRFVNDEYDPWYGAEDNIWQDEVKYPPEARGLDQINKWYEDVLSNGKKIYKWKTDIFGNNYGLMKDESINSIYNLKLTTGEMWVRNAQDKIDTGSALLSSIYDKFNTPSAIQVQLNNDQIYDFDIWYDTIMFETTGYTAIQKILFDYDTGRIYSIADNSRFIDLSSNDGGYFAGSWLFEEQKDVTLCNVFFNAASSVVYPYLHHYDINTGEIRNIYNGDGVTTFLQMSSIGLTDIEKPIFNYNYLSRTYNVSFVGHDADGGMILTTMNLEQVASGYAPTVTTILPVSG